MNAGSEMTLDEAELAALRDSIADVLKSECDSRKVHTWLDRENDLGPAIWRQAVELGWLGLSLPEADGGLGLGARGLQILNRELGVHTVPGAFIPTLCAAQWLASVGDADQRAALLPPVLAGEAAFAVPVLIEGADAPVLSEDGNAVSGKIDMLDSATGAVATVFAVVPLANAWGVVRIDGASARTEAIQAWDMTRDISRLECSGAPLVARIADADGRAGTLLGSYLALALAADSVGGADAITHKTVEYLKERVQFDRPLATFQALRHRAANLIGHVTTQEALLEQAVQCIDNGSPDAAMWARLAKAGASEAFVFVAGDCIVLFGGVGHTWEYDPQIYIKRARLNEELLCNNRALRDSAVGLLDAALDQGRTTTEIDW
jgi:alkylation response protein AidB-like acyl-CoA dehydrogenase